MMRRRCEQLEPGAPGHIAATVRRQRFLGSPSFLPVFSPGPQPMDPLTFRVCLPISVSSVKKFPHRHTQRFVSVVIQKSHQVDNQNWSSLHIFSTLREPLALQTSPKRRLVPLQIEFRFVHQGLVFTTPIPEHLMSTISAKTAS